MTSDIIAIDGPAGSGKSTLARALAQRLGWRVLDTGAMYRAVTAQCLYEGIDLGREDLVAAVARAAQIETNPVVRINDRRVHEEIRSEAVNVAVSIVAAQPSVRAAMVEKQRDAAAESLEGLVAEGRDVTTVVFPNARVKVFLTATLSERARRRGDEGEVSVARRDHADSTRAASPLRQAHDALVIDSTGRSVDDVVEEVVACLANSISN